VCLNTASATSLGEPYRARQRHAQLESWASWDRVALFCDAASLSLNRMWT
jgi:hypothetical protein